MAISNEALLNAEVAFSNKQYNEALKWYDVVLKEEPTNIYALTRAGSACIPLGEFESALSYFGKAKDLDPSNGDVIFNYANACFFGKNYSKAFEMYVEAEKAGCSEDVLPRLYYQMAMLCSARQDIKSALVYFDKCEKSDRDNLIAMQPDMISEKLKLYMAMQDYSNAAKYAAQLVAIEPLEFKNYMVYFSILMAHKDYTRAERVLSDALEYAEMAENEKLSVSLQQIALLAAKAEANPDKKNECYTQAISLAENLLNSGNIPNDQVVDLKTSLAELYMNSEQYAKAIELLNSLLSHEFKHIEAIDDTIPSASDTDAAIESMMESDIGAIQKKIDSGELRADLGLSASVDYDEFGREIRNYDEESFSFLDKPIESKESEFVEKTEETVDLSVTAKEKIVFTLVSCYLAIEDFQSVKDLSDYLRCSDNKYYSYFGRYTSTMASWKINGNTAEVEREYAQAIAFFRNKSFADPRDVLALVFRARLYAESGKIEKAKEIASILSDADQTAILDYIRACQNDKEEGNN